MSKYLFVSTKEYKKRAEQLTNGSAEVFNVGALSIDVLCKMKFYSIEEMKHKFGIDLSFSSILITIHPETASYEKNEFFVEELLTSLKILKKTYQLVITMPNSDVLGLMIRKKLQNLAQKYNNIHIIESFGIKGYLSCMKNCNFLLGNTSSGFVEASYFPKYVINLGDRQKGRIVTPNIFSIKFDSKEIIKTVKKIEQISEPPKVNIYGIGNTAFKILDILRDHERN